MLTQLTIQNFGLIDQISLDFDSKLNILTGETGAGKSILIGALRIVLGDRISVSQLRDAKASCVIEASFEIRDPELRGSALLGDFLSSGDPTLIIQRTFSPDGRNKIKINGGAVTVAQLKEIGNHLIDFHGPHDHQMLLSSASHLQMLDRLVNFKDTLVRYKEIFDTYAATRKKLDALQGLSVSREREADLLSHQVKELGQVPLDQSKYDDLLQAQTKIHNAERISECAAEILQHLEGDDSGIDERLTKAFGPMRSLNQIDGQTAPFMDSLERMQEINQGLLSDLHEYVRGLSFDPREAQDVSAQMDIYEGILKKYGPSFEDARTFYAQACEKHDLLNNLEHNDSELRKTLAALESDLKQAAKKVTKARQLAARELEHTIEKELSELGIAKVKFEVRIAQGEFQPRGLDEVVFYISPNAGEDLKPLAQIVSSGEAARVMLALKKALIKVDPIPVLIFDEIDAQIGGRLGAVTGQKLRQISGSRQVILITHLPQIASFADAHFKVKKTVKDGRALTVVEALDKSQRVLEIAQMMSGDKESKISVRHAQDMLAQAGQ